MTYFTATVSSKGQFTIPKAMREQLGVKPGDRVAVTFENGMIVLTPIGGVVAETAGSLAKHGRRRR